MSGSRQLARVGALLLTLAGCAPERPADPAPLALRVEPAGAETRLLLIPAPGWKINARLKPALEISGGDVVRFDAVGLTADSAYFADFPSATITGRPGVISGTLRASVCAEGEKVCRAVKMEVNTKS